ncbi:MAG: hypothetical protein V4463_23810 [Pseudomonadota bacterium]
MNKLVTSCGAIAIALLGASLHAQTTPAAPSAPPPAPQSNIFLADLDLAAGTARQVRNITPHAGYNNQPAFHNGTVLFVSDRSGSTDIYRYDVASATTTQVTATEAAEFSPTPLADGSGFTVTRVADPALKGEAYTESQQLWRYTVDGKPAAAVLPTGRVGYHAWLDAGHVALFLVGNDERKQPHTLVLADLAKGSAALLSSAPGRSLGRTPDGQRVSFVDKSDPAHWVIKAMTAGDRLPTVLVATPAAEKEADRSEDYCWLPDGSLMMGKGGVLWRWDGKAGNPMRVFADLGDVGGDIKRLAASADGKRLAFVVQMRSK